MSKSCRILIVDDSAFMRMALCCLLESDPENQVVGEAKTGRQAIEMAANLQPDIITMDIEMPEMDGISATKSIMQHSPSRIIMVSSLTEQAAIPTLQALGQGASDFVCKKSDLLQLDIAKISDELLEKVRFWRTRPLKPSGLNITLSPLAPQPTTPKLPPQTRHSTVHAPVGLVVMGISTGGPAALLELFKAMGKVTAPIVVAQHMPAEFTKGFAQHLQRETGLTVMEGENGLELQPHMIVIAPGGTDTMVRERLPGKLSLVTQLSANRPIHPSADALFESAAMLKMPTLGVVLTGMGNDGTHGGQALARRGMPLLAQEPSTCTVDGMPGSLIRAGLATDILTLPQLALRLQHWAGHRADKP